MKTNLLRIVHAIIVSAVTVVSFGQSFPFQTSPNGAYVPAPHIFPQVLASSYKLGMHYSSCELMMRSGSKLGAITFNASSTVGLNSGALVDVFLDNSNYCDLRTWRSWTQVADSIDAFGQAQIVVVNSSTFRLLFSSTLVNSFLYEGGGLDVFVDGLGITSSATLSGFESAGNVGAWGVNLPIFNSNVIRPVMGGNYTVTTQNVSPTCIRTIVCSGNNQVCPGEEICLYLKKQDGIFANDAGLNFSWERTSTPCDAASWLSIPASNAASLSVVAPTLSGIYYYRCKITDGASIFYSSLSGTCSVAGCNDYFSIIVVPALNSLGCYDEPDLEEISLGARISEVEMKVNGAMLLKSNTNYINGVCSGNADSYQVYSRPNATFLLSQLTEAPIINPTFSWMDFADALSNQGVPEVHPGDLIDFKVRMSNCDKPMLYNHALRLEFDWDNNQTFETIYNFTFAEAFPVLSNYQGSEESLLLNPLDADSVIYQKSFVVPCDIVCGTNVVTKFRVALKRLPTGWGDAEDYAIKSLCNDVSINYSGGTTICQGQSKLLSIGIGSSFQWNKDGVPISGATSNSYTATESGAYTVTVFIAGCTYTSTVVNILVDNLMANAGSDFTKTCVNNISGAAIGETGVLGCSYSWTPIMGLSASNVNNPIANPSSTTTYTLTKTNLATGCVATDQVVVSVNTTAPIVSAGMDVNVCLGDSIALNASGALTYVWNNGITDGVYFQPSMSTIYIVVGTDTNGCEMSDTLVVTVQIPITYYLDADNDGFGSASLLSCIVPSGNYVLIDGDCDDTQSNIYPSATELCNGFDDNCNALTDEGCSMGMALSTAQLTSAPQYGMPGTNFSHLFNMSLASDYPESSSGIHEKWFKFQALSNAVRIEVVGAASNDDNSIRMFADPGVIYSAPLAVLVEENDVNFLTVGVVDQGNEILLTDVLTEGQWYYVCITTLNGTPGNVTVKFNSLLPSTCDVGPFTSYTGIYTNACQTFKCQYRTQARRAIINKWSGMAQVGFPISTYTIPAPTSLITTCQLSKITPVNMSGANQTIFISADLEYNLQDAAGNMNVLFARQSSNCSFQLSSEATSNVRSTDECPVYKSYASSIATDRTICGASQYQWEFSMVYPSPGLPVFASGASNSRILALASIPGMANGQRYDVRIRSLYSDATTYSNWSGMADCVRTIGAAGISPLEWGGLKVSDHEHITLYPNPTRFQNQIVVTWQDEVFSSIEIYNAQGQKVSNYQGKDLVNNKLEIEASFAVGLYHVVFIGSNETIALQWMIE